MLILLGIRNLVKLQSAAGSRNLFREFPKKSREIVVTVSQDFWFVGSVALAPRTNTITSLIVIKAMGWNLFWRSTNLYLVGFLHDVYELLWNGFQSHRLRHRTKQDSCQEGTRYYANWRDTSWKQRLHKSENAQACRIIFMTEK